MIQSSWPLEKKKLELITYFSLWKSVKKDRSNAYDCDVCLANGFIEGRRCYHPDHGELKYELPIYQFEENQDPQFGMTMVEGYNPEEHLEELDAEEVLEELARIQELMPDRPIFNLLLELYPETMICPTGLIDGEFNDILVMEERSQKYGIFPYPGGQLDQPAKLMKLFDIIRAETAHFERDRMVEIESESKDPNK